MMRIKRNSYIEKLLKFIVVSVGSGFIGYWIGIYMDRPDISYYATINQPARISVDNSRKILKTWNRSRRNLRRRHTYSSSVYISNTGHHAYRGNDFSHSKNPLRIETDSPMKLFTIDDKESPETTVSIKDKNGIYYIEFDFLNYGRNIKFVFTHSQPIKYLYVKGSGVDLPYIRKRTPLKVWLYNNFFLTMVIFVIIGLILFKGILNIYDYKRDKEYYQFLQQFSEKKRTNKKKINNKTNR